MKKKISSFVDQKAWDDLRGLAEQSHQSVSEVLTEAIREYVQRRRMRPEVLRHLEESLEANEKLGKLLAE